IFNLLRSYIALVEQVSGFQCCKFGEEVKPALNKLQDDMSKCVKSTGDRKLFSFSIFTARVFAVGDPTHHTEGSAQKCM
uniref:Uncharacterized protein n=1 Tax=Acanthochromis polyacanthus TaxID=80966 RepID=A0A3Q1FQ93_9TELE